MNVIDAEERILTVAELAVYLRVSTNLVYKLTSMGRLPYYRVGRIMRFDWNEVKQAIHINGQEVDRSCGREISSRGLSRMNS